MASGQGARAAAAVAERRTPSRGSILPRERLLKKKAVEEKAAADPAVNIKSLPKPFAVSEDEIVHALYKHQDKMGKREEELPDPLVNIKAFPKLLAVGEDDNLHGHHSYEIVQALAEHHDKMDKIEKETSRLKEKDRKFKGHSSGEIADAFQKYMRNHPGAPSAHDASKDMPTLSKLNPSFLAGSSSSGSQLMSDMARNTTLVVTGTYSWANLLQSMTWARTLYAIVWIVTGLIVLFFGYASLFWLSNTKTPRILQRHSGSSKNRASVPGNYENDNRHSTSPRHILSGGIGGVLVGFLFFSYLAAVIHNATCVDTGRSALSPAAYFAVWLVPGLFGAILGSSFAWLTRAMAGVLGATCLTVILTAVFGIKTLLIRAILLGILTLVLTSPLLLPRNRFVRMIVLNVCTSVIGMVTFLNGVALVAPAKQPSSNWLDLWTVLFMKKSIGDDDALVAAWGSSVFKGYIAGAVLGSAVGFAFELLLHRHAGEDPESEWNQYLGTYTQRIEEGAAAPDNESPTLSRFGARKPKTAAEMAARAGLFEAAPTPWQRMVDYFDSDASRPVRYGNLSGDGTSLLGKAGGDGGAGHDTGSPSLSAVDRMRQKRSTRNGRTSRGGPARFEALSKRDEDCAEASEEETDFDEEMLPRKAKGGKTLDDDDDESTDCGSAAGDKKEAANTGGSAVDGLPVLSKNGPVLSRYGGDPLPQPPRLNSPLSEHTESSNSHLSGTTARNTSTRGSGEIRRSAHVYRDGDSGRRVSAGVGTGGAGDAAAAAAHPAEWPPQQLPVTPSLIHAISRVQRAQQQARDWQEQHDTQGGAKEGASK